MHWWMVPLATLSGLVVLAPAICRHLRRRRVVARVRAELAWFYQPRSPRERFAPSGKHASTTPVVVLRQSDGTVLAMPRSSGARRR
ncbi:hypothetical protein [Saccharopolyspora sp. ASAGF58]|uniref:hypothetical protein n=1 Tax=Saccharopolyspora sp. ASAGF58 TaxID=2719023 RepID=UPI001447DB19|nr:hypothetical protein [Saccharopolyspora sp. ASAGF58]